MKQYFMVFITLSIFLNSNVYSDSVIWNDKKNWKLSGGKGRWQTDQLTGEKCLTVSGTGEKGDSNYWMYSYAFQPNQLYKISG